MPTEKDVFLALVAAARKGDLLALITLFWYCVSAICAVWIVVAIAHG